jgi:hypothetical protein
MSRRTLTGREAERVFQLVHWAVQHVEEGKHAPAAGHELERVKDAGRRLLRYMSDHQFGATVIGISSEESDA